MGKSNLPKEYKKGIGIKVKEFFNKLFGIKQDISFNDNLDLNSENVNEEIETNNLRDELKYKLVKDDCNILNMSNDRLIKEYRKNPKLLDILSVEKLRELNSYYDELIAKCDEKINKAG